MTEFKGWDWTEVLPLIGISHEKYEEAIKSDLIDGEEEIYLNAVEAIQGHIGSKSRETLDLVGELREFLALVNRKDQGTIRAGGDQLEYIEKIENQDEFLYKFGRYLRCMWT